MTRGSEGVIQMGMLFREKNYAARDNNNDPISLCAHTIKITIKLCTWATYHVCYLPEVAATT